MEQIKTIEFTERLTTCVIKGWKTNFLREIPNISEKDKFLGLDKNTAVFRNKTDKQFSIKKLPYKINDMVTIKQPYKNAINEWETLKKKKNNHLTEDFCNDKIKKCIAANQETETDKKKQEYIDLELMPYKMCIKDLDVMHIRNIADLDKIQEGINLNFNVGSMTFYYFLPGIKKEWDLEQSYFVLDDAYKELVLKFLHGKTLWDHNSWIYLYKFECCDITGKKLNNKNK